MDAFQLGAGLGRPRRSHLARHFDRLFPLGIATNERIAILAVVRGHGDCSDFASIMGRRSRGALGGNGFHHPFGRPSSGLVKTALPSALRVRNPRIHADGNAVQRCPASMGRHAGGSARQYGTRRQVVSLPHGTKRDLLALVKKTVAWSVLRTERRRNRKREKKDVFRRLALR
ncbi:hypothetical protein [Mesorhizobium sp. M0296]|uniref:hypothetical protein n=1 Tax=Mesorhizobium sp. M0296 TaxID=2956931 RepID=UPI00333D8101